MLSYDITYIEIFARDVFNNLLLNCKTIRRVSIITATILMAMLFELVTTP